MDSPEEGSDSEPAKKQRLVRPVKKDLPAPDVRGFRAALEAALGASSPGQDYPIAKTKWGVYVFYDYEREPIYVGQTNESLRTRIRRHLTNQRTDAVGMHVLDPFEILELELWPLRNLEGVPSGDRGAKHLLDRLERTIYERAIERSRYGVILNEKLPPSVPLLTDSELPEPFRFSVVPDEVAVERGHPDNRVARRGEKLNRLTQVVRERGEVSDGLRRVVVVQAIRLAWLSAQRLAEAEGREAPDYRSSIDLAALIGNTQDPEEAADE